MTNIIRMLSIATLAALASLGKSFARRAARIDLGNQVDRYRLYDRYERKRLAYARRSGIGRRECARRVAQMNRGGQRHGR